MSGQANAPVIIKRKKIVGGEGHHGGAWKVAYADFVTAMMAFFLLMWLLNATTEQQRKGIADYFSPTIPINRVSGGGDGMFGGDDIFTDEALARSGSGDVADQADPQDLPVGDPGTTAAAAAAEVAALREIEDALLGRGGESLLSSEALRHVVTRVTDEGLVIEIFALPGAPLFDGDDRLRPLTGEILDIVARLSGLVTNGIAVAGHVPARPVVLSSGTPWRETAQRADLARARLQDGGADPTRFRRIAGHGDRVQVEGVDPASERNERIEVTLLRTPR